MAVPRELDTSGSAKLALTDCTSGDDCILYCHSLITPALFAGVNCLQLCCGPQKLDQAYRLPELRECTPLLWATTDGYQNPCRTFAEVSYALVCDELTQCSLKTRPTLPAQA
jgi:hypothetical protein